MSIGKNISEVSDIKVAGIKSSPTDLLSKHGVTRDDFAKCLKGGLTATKDIKDRDGDVIETIADWNVRHKFLSTGLEWIKEINGSGTVVNVVSEDVKQAQEAFGRWRLLEQGMTGEYDGNDIP